MPNEAILDFRRPDAVPGRRDHVVVAAHEVKITPVIEHALITGEHPIADEFFLRCFVPAPIVQKHHGVWTPDRDLTNLAVLASSAVRPHYADRVAGHC